jgi:hypothetical protein
MEFLDREKSARIITLPRNEAVPTFVYDKQHFEFRNSIVSASGI